MCWLMNAWPSTTSVTLFLRSAPRASTGGRWQRRHSAGRVAARAAQDRRAGRTDADDRIVDPARDRTLADRGRRRRVPTSRSTGVVVLVGERLARPVGAGHDEQRRRAAREQQVMQRRVRQHDAELAVVGRHVEQRLARPAPGRSGGAIDSRSDARQRPRGGQRSCATVEVPRHQRERLFLAELPRPQRPHRCRVGGVARQVIAAEPFDGHDVRLAPAVAAAARIGSAPCRPRGAARLACRNTIARPAVGTRHRLRVEAPVARDRDTAARTPRKVATARIVVCAPVVRAGPGRSSSAARSWCS